MKFIHMGDCHLGGWSIPELRDLNLESFQYVVKYALENKADFVLIAGDLFDSSYPSLDTIKETFNEFRKLKEADIPVFLIAGSHDYSVSGKSFLDVLEKAGFAKNVSKFEERKDKLVLLPTIYKNIAIYGYPGRKSGLEVNDIEKIAIDDSPGLFRILMLHTTIRDAIGTLPIPAVNQENLPKVEYTALAHLHLKYNKNSRVYCGPTFPNNLSELEDLHGGSFYVVDTSSPERAERKEIKLKDVLVLDLEITDSFSGTDKIISEIENHDIKDKIFILKLKGLLQRGRISDINFHKVESKVREKGAYVFLRNTTRLKTPELELRAEFNSDNIEEEIISAYKSENPNKLNELIPDLINILQVERKEDETSKVFEERLHSELNKVIWN